MYILGFDEITKNDVAQAGGKGANLGEMTGCGIPVPRGFVICADGYRHFIQENGLDEKFASLLAEAGDSEDKLIPAASTMRERILNSPLPADLREEIKAACEKLQTQQPVRTDLRLAIRSSATAEDLPDDSFAGQQETYLNVCGLDEVFTHVQKCYASLWGDRAVSYRLHRGYSQSEVALAVVIQEMVEAEKAGVLFTVNPVTNNTSQIQINASYGLGESVVSGRVTADSILCDKEGAVLTYEVGSKKTQILYDVRNTKEVPVSVPMQKSHCLTEEEIRALCEEGCRIEKHYGFPMDIEWAIRSKKVYILQARAITTLHSKPDDAATKALIADYLKDSKISGPATANMAFQLEKMPYAYRAFDYDLMIQINTQKAILLGEAGLNLTSDPRMDDDAVMTLPQNSFGLNKNILHFPTMLKLLKDYPRCEEKCLKFMPVYEKKLAGLQDIRFEDMSLKKCGEFLTYAYELLGKLCYDRFKYALFPSVLGNHLTKAVRKLDKKYTNYDLYKGLENKTAVITNEAAALADSIRSRKAMCDDILSGMDFEHLCAKYPDGMDGIHSYLVRNGFKSDFNCYCVISRTLKEDPDRLLNILRPLLASKPKEVSADPSSEYEEMLSGLRGIYGRKFPALQKEIECFRTFHIVREESQYLWESLFYYVRRALTRANLLLVGNPDYLSGISNLFYAELTDACKRGCLNDTDKEKIRRRDEKHPLAQKVWDASKLLVFRDTGDILKGVSGSSGVAVGPVCIVRNPSEFHKIKKGDILVCELTDPEWTPLFSLASAVVADTGSSLSHAAIVAREFGIPAVLGVGLATSKFKDGDTVKVDGDKGVVSAC